MKRYYGLIPGLAVLVVYSTTTCRSIWIGDSGEFALALKSLGICHPPGYPLFTIMGRVFVLLMPFLRPIFAAGMFNIVVASATVVVIGYIFRRDLDCWLAALLSLLWAFCPLLWAETAGVEIYTLNMLLISLTFLAMESTKRWKWPMAVYLFGLSLTNHPSALSLAPALIYLFIREKRYRQWKLLIPIFTLLIAVAGSVYLYMLVRSQSDPISDWGNPESVTALINHMTLKQYSGWVHISFENLFVSVRLFIITLLKSWWWIGAIALVSGVIAGWSVARTRTVMALMILISSLLLVSSHQALDYEPFYLVPMFAVLLLIGNNFIWLKQRDLPHLVMRAIAVVGFVCMLALLLLNYPAMDKSDYTLAEDYGKLILDTADKGILFTAGDINSFPALYLRYAENYEPDVEVFDRSVRRQKLLDKAHNLIGHEINNYYQARAAVIQYGNERKYLTKNLYMNEPHWLDLTEPIFSYGILYAVRNKPSEKATIPLYPRDYDPGDPLSRQLLVNLDLARGEDALQSMPPDTTEALKAFSTALHRMENEPRAEPLNQIGIYFRKAKLPDFAMEAYRTALQKPLITSSQRRDITYNISNIHKDRGNAFAKAGNYEGAVASYIEALTCDPDNSKLLLNIGSIYAQALKDTNKAIVYLNKYLELNPSDTKTRDWVNTLKR